MLSFLAVTIALIGHVTGQGGQTKPTVTVTTQRGIVNGFHEDLGSDTSQIFYGQADVFLGVPYAVPPVGDLRFKLPQRLCSYSTPVNATAYRDQCTQNPVFRQISEPPLHSSDDCLYLNIASPSVTSPTKVPVMVWFHSGGLTYGSADMFDYKGAVRNMVTKGVVVVTVGYRLGMTGFFTTFTEDFPANRGFFDQSLALRWIQEEISAFGGDPNQVTIFGESAGGASVNAHSLSPVSRGLFRKTIEQSGAALIQFIAPNNPNGDIYKKRAQEICGFTSAQWAAGDFSSLVSCLASKSSSDLALFDQDIVTNPLNGQWPAALDGAFFPKTLSQLAVDRPNYPVLQGDCHDEYSIVMDTNVSLYDSSFIQRELTAAHPEFGAALTPGIANAIARTFKRTPVADDDHQAWADIVVEVFTNMYFSSFFRRSAQWYLDNGNPNIFIYTFQHPGTPCKNVQIGNTSFTYHTSELCYLWMYPYFWQDPNVTKTAEDVQLADFIGTVWTNFAKGGDSSPPYNGWNPVSNSDNFEFYQFTQNPGTMQKHYRSDGNVLFNDVLPALFGEYPRETPDAATLQSVQAVGANVLAAFNGTSWCFAQQPGQATSSSTQSTSPTDSTTILTTSTTGQTTTSKAGGIAASLTLLLLLLYTL